VEAGPPFFKHSVSFEKFGGFPKEPGEGDGIGSGVEGYRGARVLTFGQGAVGGSRGGSDA
jgi:hypothetical protein